MKPNLLGGQNSKRLLKKSRFIYLQHLCSRRLGEGVPFRLYVAVEDNVIGAVLTEEPKTRSMSSLI